MSVVAFVPYKKVRWRIEEYMVHFKTYTGFRNKDWAFSPFKDCNIIFDYVSTDVVYVKFLECNSRYDTAVINLETD
jgi:hypothetical protein